MSGYKDRNGNDLEVGNRVSCSGLIFEITGFTKIVGQTMVSGEYGDFNISILEKISDDAEKDIAPYKGLKVK
jgi:hypothetical protein